MWVGVMDKRSEMDNILKRGKQKHFTTHIQFHGKNVPKYVHSTFIWSTLLIFLVCGYLLNKYIIYSSLVFAVSQIASTNTYNHYFFLFNNTNI